MCCTLLTTPVANLGAHLAILGCPSAISGHHFYGYVARIYTYDAAIGAVIHTGCTSHGYQTILAVDQTLLTGFETGLVFGIHNGQNLNG